MKRIYMALLLALFGALACTSCSKNNDNTTTTTPTVPYPMTATVGSTQFTMDSCELSVNILDTNSIEISAVTGSNANPGYPIIELHLVSGYHGVGTYTLGSAGAPCWGRLYQSYAAGEEYTSTGTVTISATYPTTISGTFSFTTVANTVVTNGSFIALKY